MKVKKAVVVFLYLYCCVIVYLCLHLLEALIHFKFGVLIKSLTTAILSIFLCIVPSILILNGGNAKS